MQLRIFTEPQQGATYDDLLRVAQAAERLGFDAFFRSDHFLRIGPLGSGSPHGAPGPSESWVTLAGIARETSTIRLGTLVTSATFRLPGPLAIAVANVDQMSGGRVELGIGTGWFAEEHAAYGIPFPASGERFDRLEEQLQIIDGLWRTPVGERFSFTGHHYRLDESPALPKPAQQPRPPIIIGGAGPRRTPALAARFADEYNVAFRDLGTTGQLFEGVRAAVDAAGRAPETMTYSAAQTVCVGRGDADVARRANAIGQDAAVLRETALAGTPDEVVDKIRRFEAAGATRSYLQVLDLTDLDHLELIAAEVLPRV